MTEIQSKAITKLIADIKARSDAATKGPWSIGAEVGLNLTEITAADGSRAIAYVFIKRQVNRKGNMERFDNYPELTANAEFIANARADIESLISALEELMYGA